MLTDPLMKVARPVRFRGKRRLLSGLIPSRGEASATIFGYRVRLDLAEAMQREIYMGTFEPDEAALLQGFLKPGMTFVDVGANVGFFTLMASRAVGPGGRVHAVEPGPYAHRRLAAIVRENGIAQATVHPIGLGDVEGTIELYEPGEVGDNYSPSAVPNPGWRPIPVPVRRLDDCLADWGLGPVDILKIDAEGYEPRIIEGARGSFGSGAIRNLYIEFNDFYLRKLGSSPEGMCESLLAMGFADLHGPCEFPAGCVTSRFFSRRG